MIRRPAERAGLVLEEGLADEILKDAGGEPGEALPLVAFCLDELYRRTIPEHRLTLDAYRAINGLRGAIGRRAGELLEGIKSTEEAGLDAVLPRAFRALVHVDAAGKVTRQRAFRDELMAAPAPIPRLIETLVHPGRLLLADDSGGRATVILAHEALIQEWPALREWLECDLAQMQRVQRSPAASSFARVRGPSICDRSPWADRAGSGRGGAGAGGRSGRRRPERAPAAAAALGQIGPAAAEAVPALVTALGDANEYVRQPPPKPSVRSGRRRPRWCRRWWPLWATPIGMCAGPLPKPSGRSGRRRPRRCRRWWPLWTTPIGMCAGPPPKPSGGSGRQRPRPRLFDTPGHVLLVAHDITNQKQVEKEREDIIGFVAHELRNPLANIVLCNEMMTQLIADNEMEELGEYLDRSKSNVLRLNKMIGQLYDATKFNSGHFVVEKTTFDFEEMIEEALDTIEVLHPDYSIIVEGECTSPVYGDRYRLIQVVTNFLSNGIKYSNNNTKVLINISRNEDSIIVSVKDEGLGISPKHLPHIFDRFFRAEKTKNLEGIGLGLYLCRRIIEAHDGKVWAESEEGKGSTFFFSIPA